MNHNKIRPRLGVVIHLYYEDLIRDFRYYLQHIPEPFDLYISTPQGKGKQAEKKFSHCSRYLRELYVEEVPNSGRDIAPFLLFYGQHYQQYQYTLKIHTKKSPHQENLSVWFHYLLENLAGSKNIVENILQQFDQDAGLGMIYPETFYAVRKHIQDNPWGENRQQSLEILEKAGIAPSVTTEPLEFPSGSMFWIRNKALEKLFQLPLRWDDFSGLNKIDGTLAHAIERVFLLFVTDNGFSGKRVLFTPNDPVAFTVPPRLQYPVPGNMAFWLLKPYIVIRNITLFILRYLSLRIISIVKRGRRYLRYQFFYKPVISSKNHQISNKQIHYHLDEIEDESFTFYLRGWIFHEDFKVKEASVIIRYEEKEEEYPVTVNLIREDVSRIFPFETAYYSGFSCQIFHAWSGKFIFKMKVNLENESAFYVDFSRHPIHTAGVECYSATMAHGHRKYLSRHAEKADYMAVYVSSHGNYFFTELAELLILGIQSAGYRVELHHEENGFVTGADWHIVMAPHEFFYLGMGIQLAGKPMPPNLILFNTEQPSSVWFRKTARFFPFAFAIWDMEYGSSQMLKARLPFVHYLPLGFDPDFSAFCETVTLPDHPGTAFLEPEVKEGHYRDSAVADRPFDIFFVGFASPRRQQFFAQHAALFARYRCYFHFSDGQDPVIPGKNSCMDTRTITGLLQRSKIVINIHHGTDEYFEWHRIVLQGIWQKALVITETSRQAPPFTAGYDYVQTDLANLAGMCEYYLSTEVGRKEATGIINQATQTLREACLLRDTVTTVLQESEMYSSVQTA